MKNYFLKSSDVIANDSALTLWLRPEHPWVPSIRHMIRDEAVQRVHKSMQQMSESFLHMPDNGRSISDKNIQQMIESFLYMPDNEVDAPAWWK